MITPLSKNRVALGWVVALATFYLASPTPRSLLAGLPLAILGLIIRGVAAGTIRKGHALAQTGIYGLTRNPLYLGSTILTLAFGIMCGSPLGFLLLILVSGVVYPPIIRNEENELRDSFGSEFDTYRRAVPCFLPGRFSAQVLGTFSYRQYLANREYNATLGFLAAAGILVTKYLVSVV